MNSQKGFTLIELLITVVILGVLAAIALPAYQNMVIKSNRSEAKAELSDVAQRLQRCYTVYGRYNDTTPTATNRCAVFESMENGVITSAGRGFYEIDLVNSTATTFEIQAVPVLPPQTSDTVCDDMRITHTGAKTPAGCW